MRDYLLLPLIAKSDDKVFVRLDRLKGARERVLVV